LHFIKKTPEENMIQKKKVGIITLHGYENYGNKLQNYALQEIIKELGYEAHTLIITDTKRKSSGNKFLSTIKANIDKPINIICKKIVNKINKKLYYYRYSEIIKRRTSLFKEFSNMYLNEQFYSNRQSELEMINKNYDYFIAGSDQIWNPQYINNSGLDFLVFADENKRIAYAPSFGMDNIPEECKKNYIKWISKMKYLSVREVSGVAIIKELINRDVPVLVDPTLLLSKDRWLNVSKLAHNKPKDKYLLTYFLGGMTKEIKKSVNNIAKKYNFQIVHLANINEKKSYVTSPCEFIDYINSASLVFTDSFHGVVFSILMEKPFVVYKRITESFSIYSRIETLLDMFQLKSREAINIKKNEKELFSVNYSHIQPILEIERNEAINYLKKALNVIE
jgi:hypothetical protein